MWVLGYARLQIASVERFRAQYTMFRNQLRNAELCLWAIKSISWREPKSVTRFMEKKIINSFFLRQFIEYFDVENGLACPSK